MLLARFDNPSKLADTIASHLMIKLSEKQEILALLPVRDRLERVLSFMEGEISVLQVEKRIRSHVKRQMEKNQREYYLNEQMKAIQKELGASDDSRDELSELEERITKTKLRRKRAKRLEQNLENYGICLLCLQKQQLCVIILIGY